MPRATVLLIDDEAKLRALLARIISLEGYACLQAGDLKEGRRLLEQHPVDIVLCDVRLPDGNGLEFTSFVREKYPQAPVILLTAYGNIADGVQAMKNGALDYLVKGDDNDKIIPLLNQAEEMLAVRREVRRRTEKPGTFSFDDIIAFSPRMKACVDLARKVAPTDASVLLIGETGTGKELFAQAIHTESRRAGRFVALNCGAFSREILESELFGHRAGAFTGAVRDKKGLFEEAHDGTIFLDEIGEMPPGLQATLLRVLESGEFYPVGDTKPRRVDVRVIAATHRNLKSEIDAGGFRADLFYRLSVFRIDLPALRERPEDIGPLAIHFLRVFAKKFSKPVQAVSPACLERLSIYDWPGNTRELRNIIERAVILESDAELTPGSLPPELQALLPAEPDGAKPMSAFELAAAEKLHIIKVLNHTGGNKTETARLLNIGVATLYRKLQEYGIR